MDDKIAELLCDRCRPLLAAAFKLERAELQRKQARDELKALTQGKLAEAEDDEPDMHHAMLQSKAKMGGANAHKGFTHQGTPRKRAESKLTRDEVKRRLDVAHDDLLRVIRGDFQLTTLMKHLGVPPSSGYYRIEKMIGTHREGDPNWVQGIGYKRHGKRAYDVLKKKAGKAWKEPSTRALPTSPLLGGAAPEPEPEEPPMFNKPGRPGPNDPPKPTISVADLQALSNGKTTQAALCKQYRVSTNYVASQLRMFKQRYGVLVEESGDAAQSEAEAAEEEPEPRITDTDLFRLRNRRVAVNVIADRYGLEDDEVRKQLSEWIAAKAVVHAVAAEDIRNGTSSGDVPSPPTLASIAQQVLRS